MKYLSISFKSLFLFIILLTSTSGANALDLAERMAVADSLRMRLTQKISPSDSLSVLVNLYDVLPRSQGNLLADSIINLAMRTREEMVAFDIIRNDVNRHMRSDSIIESRLKLTLEKFPLSEGREETETFIRMVRNMRRSIYADEFDRNIMLERLKQEFDNNPPTDLYERIVLLHAMVMMLSQDPNSSLMVQYMDTLGQLVNQLPPMAFSVRNAFNVHAATAFQNSDPVKSLEADRRSLNDINKLVKFYSDRGRHFRIYDTNRYVIYCRMLNNWSVLSDKEFDDLYDQAIQLTETDPDARARYQAFAEPDLYRSLRYKDYEKAYPLLKKMIEPKVFSTLSNPRRIRVLKNFILTCKTLNKSDDLAEASLRLNEILEKEMEFRTQGLFREIRLAYANYDMRRHYGDLENETRKSRERLTIEVLVLSILGLVLMGIFIVLLLRQYSRMRVLAKSLKISNAKLQKESTNLKKAKVELKRARDSAVK
ncbi:MAG: hypothetical protein K2K55_10220, partial [Duncaniella sp.]|nr:hypothetical protein [Duncaniella sp.]